MFFVLSKLLKFAITPLIWVMVFLVLAVITRDEFKRKQHLKWALGLLLLFSSPLLFNISMSFWELPLTRYKDLKHYEAAVVMGGMVAYNEEKDRVQFLKGADRLFQAIDLYKTGKVKKIIFSGGSGFVLHPEYKEGVLVKQYVLRLGIPEDDFIVEPDSRNTHENAVFTKQIIDKHHIQGNLLLITSAFHMRRSLACFNKQGIYPQTFCTDAYVRDELKPKRWDLEGLFIPSLDTMQSWTNFIHELVGYAVYKLMGYA